MTIRTLCAAVFGLGLFAASVQAQSLPDWAAPSGPAPTASDASFTPGAPPPPPPPTPVPIDGGLSLLALAGAGYAAHRLRNRNRAA